MDELEIESYLQYFKPFFKGVFAANELPSSRSDGCYILNTDSRLETGTHWIAICVKRNCIYLFDSLALNCIEDFYVNRFLNFFKKKYIFVNDFTIQSPLSNVCGVYCILFVIYMRLYEHEFRGYLNSINAGSPVQNDARVLDIFNCIFM